MGKVVCSPTQTQNQGRARKARLWVGVPGSSIPEVNPQEVDKALAFTRDTLDTSGREHWVEETALLALCRISSLPASPTHCPSVLSPREKAAETLLSLSGTPSQGSVPAAPGGILSPGLALALSLPGSGTGNPALTLLEGHTGISAVVTVSSSGVPPNPELTPPVEESNFVPQPRRAGVHAVPQAAVSKFLGTLLSQPSHHPWVSQT